MAYRVKAAAEWLSPAQVAELFGVDPKTVTRWAKAGSIPAEHVRRTPACGGPGHRRIRRAWLESYLNGGAS